MSRRYKELEFPAYLLSKYVVYAKEMNEAKMGTLDYSFFRGKAEMLKEILSEAYNMEIKENEKDWYIARDEAGGREVRIRKEDWPK